MFHGVVEADEESVSFTTDEPGRSFHVPLRRFPHARGEADRELAVSPDGTILVGANDGSLIALDIAGRPLYQLGVRGAVLEIKARPAGGFAVTTPGGEVLVDSALPAPVEPPVPPPAPITFHVTPPPGGRGPDIVLSADEAWTLETRDDGAQSLHRFDGKAWRDVRMAEMDGPRLWQPHGSYFAGEMLQRGPKGQLLLLGERLDWNPSGPAIDQFSLRVFEWTGKGFRERREMMGAYEQTAVQAYLSDANDPMSYVVGPGGREIVCLDVNCIAHGLPASFHADGAGPQVKTRAAGWMSFVWGDNHVAHGRRAMLFAGGSLFRSDFFGFSKDGKNLIEGEAVFEGLDAGKYPWMPDPSRLSRKRSYEDPGRDGPTRGMWASGPDDVWVSVGLRSWASALFRWNGTKLTSVPRPLAWIDAIWGAAADDVWFTGDGVAHYDGHEIRRIPGIPPGRIVGGVAGDAWIADWHVVRAPAPSPDLSGAPAKTPKVSPPSAALEPSANGPGVKIEGVTLKIPGEAPLTTAFGIEEGSSGRIWLHDRVRLVEFDGSDARVLHRGTGADLFDCQRCLAPRAAGEGLFLSQGQDRMTGLREIKSGAVTDVYWSPDMLAAATAPNGDVWIVSAAEDHGVARAFVRTASGVRNVSGLPIAAYANLAVRANDDVWLSGGMVAFHDGTRAQPAGEGILVHFDGHAFSRYRGPDGALLSVAAVGPREAWAAGLDGGIVHVKEGVVTAYHLERSGEASRVALRAVSANGPDDVWIAGDGSTLLHWNGKGFSRVDLAGIGADAALTALVPPRDKVPGWLAGPRGIWRLTRMEKAADAGP